MAGDLDLQPDGVLIAIGADLPDRLQIAGAFALLPDLAARAAEIVGDAGFERKRQRLVVHMCDHQQLAVARIRHHGRHQAVGVEFRREAAVLLERVLVGGRRGEDDGHRSGP
ncbi:hypothetical protein D3C72_2133750 [compost metagenome]